MFSKDKEKNSPQTDLGASIPSLSSLGSLADGVTQNWEFKTLNLESSNVSSLNSLANLHLNELGSNSSLANGWILKPLSLDDNATALPTLDSLAQQHLEDGVSNDGLGSWSMKPLLESDDSSTISSLGTLANLHLTKELPTTLNSNSILKSDSKEFSSTYNKSSPDFNIDLTSALCSKNNRKKNLTLNKKSESTKKDSQLYKEPSHLEEVLVHAEVGTRTGNVSVLQQPSKVASVICRKWKQSRALSLLPVKITSGFDLSKLTPFTFDTPSPDDVVRAAQAKSKAFGQRLVTAAS